MTVRDKTARTPRGVRTRGLLLAAARTVFAECGFLDARITDIAEQAGVAHGTFYTHFDSKEQVFREVVKVAVDDVYASSAAHDGDDPDPIARIELANRRYLAAVAKHASLLRALDQLASYNEQFRDVRREMRGVFVERAARGIARLQAEGLADSALDPGYAAHALGSMVEHFGYVWHVLGEPFDSERAIETLTRLWAQSLGIPFRRNPEDEFIEGKP